MTVSLTLICHAATRAVREAAFPADEPLDEPGLAAARGRAQAIRRVDTALTSPALCASQTAETLGLQATVDAGLRDLDYGRWSGRSLADVAAAHPEAVEAWRLDSSAAPHGGETIDALLGRTASWLESVRTRDDRVVAVTHVPVIRAVIVTALAAPALSFWRIDIAPLCTVKLRGGPNGWTLLSIGL